MFDVVAGRGDEMSVAPLGLLPDEHRLDSRRAQLGHGRRVSRELLGLLAVGQRLRRVPRAQVHAAAVDERGGEPRDQGLPAPVFAEPGQADEVVRLVEPPVGDRHLGLFELEDHHGPALPI
jgi:hypothetical protein